MKNIREQVLKAIKTGEVKMRPKWHFVLRGVFWAVGLILAFLTLLYLAGFIVFALRETGIWFVPGFGLWGFGMFFLALPWLLILVAFVFLVLLGILVRRYEFAYVRPLLYSTLAIILMVVLGGLAFARAPLHRGLFLRFQHGGIPGVMVDSRNIVAGEVKEISGESIKVNAQRGETFEIKITPETRFPFGTDLAPGDRIVILGERRDGIMQAYGIRRIDGEMPHMRRFRGKFRFDEIK